MKVTERACRFIKSVIKCNWLSLTDEEREFMVSVEIFKDASKWSFPQGSALFIIDFNGAITAKHDASTYKCNFNQLLIHGRDMEAEFLEGDLESESLKSALCCIELLMLYMTANEFCEAIKHDVDEGLEEYHKQIKYMDSWGKEVE